MALKGYSATTSFTKCELSCKLKKRLKQTYQWDSRNIELTFALELGVPGVGIPPGMLASNSDPLPFSKVGDCLNVVSEDCKYKMNNCN